MVHVITTQRENLGQLGSRFHCNQRELVPSRPLIALVSYFPSSTLCSCCFIEILMYAPAFDISA
ncbi:uncharacterized protein K489DRAFT_1820 [Dissoconium aciculare CBS 342.82]|uniref:Uncharacterized protein n=1 Tax=Dissoconium aciculare CBS 342.82 TaxID=1314786 RepID=A0A6J3MG51_9PEZI|nr:uncharacterized protein K489DRAFT_1820 [Dissoconium aciculare CBS 342.82]KAF1826935.1 hypothetical protein K489DRAFT_1820 [Dissoconium aciculare CBS 342.82]